VKIVWSTELASRSAALAAEGVAHLFLEDKESHEVVGRKKIQVFKCTRSTALSACRRAAELINAQVRSLK
jgi:hypothetical protein